MKTAQINIPRIMVVYDLIVLLLLYLLPTISHFIVWPIYIIDPMRLCVLGSLLLFGNRRNSYILAVTLPLFSYLISGHPIPYKNVIIVVELVSNVWLIRLLEDYVKNSFVSVFTSIILSKSIYYVLKFLLISFGILKTGLVDTSVYVQIAVAVIIAFAFHVKKARI